MDRAKLKHLGFEDVVEALGPAKQWKGVAINPYERLMTPLAN